MATLNGSDFDQLNDTSDIIDDDDDDDKWLLSTFTKYKELHMYELNMPTRVLEWNRGGMSVVAASYSEDSKNEIRDLLLPNKLLKSKHKDNLALKVDFQNISGGLSEHPILSCAVSNYNTIYTAGLSTDITVWGNADNNDMMKQLEVLKMEDAQFLAPTQCHVDISQNNLLLTGGKYSDAVIRDITSNDYAIVSRFHNKEFQEYTLDALEFAENDANTIITCLHSNGDAHIWDVREQFSKPMLSFAGESVQPASQLFATSNLPTISHAIDTNSKYLARIAKYNTSFDIFDFRNSHKAILNNFKLPANYPCSINSIPQIQINSDRNLSISGFGNAVLAYRNLPELLSGSASTTGLFIHDGHKSSVTCHRWHPSEPDLVLSTEEIGNLHAWQLN